MGQIIKINGHYEYQQDDGQTTARFSHEEKMELSHKGSPGYKKAFYILILGGVLYLVLVFGFIH